MEINAIRLQNFRVLVEKYRARAEEQDLPEHGRVTRFATFCGISARYLSHILHGRKKFSSTMARTLEAAWSLPLGWMDNVHEEEPGDATAQAEREFVDMAVQLFRDNPLEVQRMMMQYMLARQPKAPSREALPREKA